MDNDTLRNFARLNPSPVTVIEQEELDNGKVRTFEAQVYKLLYDPVKDRLFIKYPNSMKRMEVT